MYQLRAKDYAVLYGLRCVDGDDDDDNNNYYYITFVYVSTLKLVTSHRSLNSVQ